MLAFTLQSLDHADPFSDSAALPADVIHAIRYAAMFCRFVSMRLPRRWMSARSDAEVTERRESRISAMEAKAASYRCSALRLSLTVRLPASLRGSNGNLPYLKASASCVAELANEVCLPLLWELAEEASLEDRDCLRFFTNGRAHICMSLCLLSPACQARHCTMKGHMQDGTRTPSCRVTRNCWSL